MNKIITLIVTSLMLFACSNSTTYNEAELIRKLDTLQHTLGQLSQRVQELETELNQYVKIQEKDTAVTTAITTAVTTTAPVQTSKITIRTTPKHTTVTTAPKDTTSTTPEQTKPVFVREEFDGMVDEFRDLISGLSSSIASSVPDEDDVVKFDQFYLYQEAVRLVDEQIKLYQSAMKEAYDSKLLDQEEFIEKERQLSKLNDALIALEDQLEVRFGMNDV